MAEIDLEEDVALFHERTFLVIALEQVAGYSCSNLGILRTIESADPFAINRHVARRCVLHEHVWRRQGFDRFLLFARRENEDAYRESEEAKGKYRCLINKWKMRPSSGALAISEYGNSRRRTR